MSRLNRRQALAGLGSVSLGALLAACGSDDETTTATTTADARTTADRFGDASDCTLTAEQTEGPYYFDTDAIRSDIREDRPGTRLRLAVRVRDADACEPIRDAVVDIWHCDAGGAYSGFQSADDERFLRGVQPTDAEGVAEFTTIYPGFYQGRTVHIHAKVHLDQRTALTTQFYFDDAVTDRVFRAEPYASAGERDQRNGTDGVYDESLTLKLSESGDGYVGLISLDVRRS
jgi:protocatechuate 3,4-dioxygenase beta subunit